MNSLIVYDNPAALSLVLAAGDKVIGAMADSGARTLDKNLSAGTRTGVQYPGQPRRSSSPSEYPQEQTSELRSMVQSGKLPDGRHFFGLVPKGTAQLKKALSLEYGAPRGNLAARSPVTRTSLDAVTHRGMIVAGRAAA